jgi:hypothetical protein
MGECPSRNMLRRLANDEMYHNRFEMRDILEPRLGAWITYVDTKG